MLMRMYLRCAAAVAIPQDYLRELENAIVYGLPYLLQDVEEELDPALEPVLNKSIIKRGNREVIKVSIAVVTVLCVVGRHAV